MQIRDDGTKLHVSSTPMLLGKIFAIVFTCLAVLFPLIVIASLVLPPRTASIDCNRARATCEFRLSAHNHTVSINDVVRAEVRYHHSTRNSSSSHYVVVYTRGGQNFDLTESGFHDNVVAGYRSAVDGLTHFLAEPTQPAFTTTFVASDEDWLVLVWFTLISPVAAWFFLKSWVTREVEIDRASRTLRVRRTPRIGKGTDTSIAFDEVRGIRLVGQNWARISVDTTNGNVELLIVPRTASYVNQVRQIVGTLSSLTGVRPQAEGPQAAYWGLNQG